MLDNEFPPLGGGTGVVNYHLLEELRKYPEIHVDLVTSSRSKSTYEQELFAKRIRIFKVPVNNLNIHHSSNIELIRYILKGFLFARKLQRAEPYDLCMAFAGVPAGFIAWLLRWMYGLPYLVSLQGPDVPGFEARYRTLYPFLRPFLRAIWGRAAFVTAISEGHRALAEKTLPGLRMPVIPNGVDLGLFSQSNGKPDRVNSNVSVLCVGRLIERKGQHYLLKAFARLLEQHRDLAQDVNLVFVGTGDSYSKLVSLADELHIRKSVVFTGVVPRENMPAIYRSADIFVLPSFNEGMSIALLEAMASCLPVIVTDAGGTAELVQRGVNGLVVPWADSEALAGAIAMLVRDQESRRSMGEAARARAQDFTWSEYAEQHLDLFRQMVQSGGSSSVRQRNN